jgi:hypothetical protein
MLSENHLLSLTEVPGHLQAFVSLPFEHKYASYRKKVSSKSEPK